MYVYEVEKGELNWNDNCEGGMVYLVVREKDGRCEVRLPFGCAGKGGRRGGRE